VNRPFCKNNLSFDLLFFFVYNKKERLKMYVSFHTKGDIITHLDFFQKVFYAYWKRASMRQ